MFMFYEIRGIIMELTPIIISFLKVVLCLIPLVFLAALIKTPWFKGFIGELIINFTIKLRLDKKNYRLLKNVTFQRRMERPKSIIFWFPNMDFLLLKLRICKAGFMVQINKNSGLKKISNIRINFKIPYTKIINTPKRWHLV